jgi:hypothetical protein
MYKDTFATHIKNNRKVLSEAKLTSKQEINVKENNEEEWIDLEEAVELEEGYKEQNERARKEAINQIDRLRRYMTELKASSNYTNCKHFSREIEDLADRLENLVENQKKMDSNLPVAY